MERAIEPAISVLNDVRHFNQALESWHQNAKVVVKTVNNEQARMYIKDAMLASKILSADFKDLYYASTLFASCDVRIIKQAKNLISVNHPTPSADKKQFRQQTSELFASLMCLCGLDTIISIDDDQGDIFRNISLHSAVAVSILDGLKKLDDNSYYAL